MTKIELEAKVAELEGSATINLSVANMLETINGALKRELLQYKSKISELEEKLTQAEEHIKDIAIDFEVPLRSVKTLKIMMNGKSWYKITEFTKQLYAHIYSDLNKSVAKQRNDLLFNSSQLEKLKRSATDISQDSLSFEKFN